MRFSKINCLLEEMTVDDIQIYIYIYVYTMIRVVIKDGPDIKVAGSPAPGYQVFVPGQMLDYR